MDRMYARRQSAVIPRGYGKNGFTRRAYQNLSGFSLARLSPQHAQGSWNRLISSPSIEQFIWCNAASDPEPHAEPHRTPKEVFAIPTACRSPPNARSLVETMHSEILRGGNHFHRPSELLNGE